MKNKPGRLTNTERLAKNRSCSTGSIKDYRNKRKRELEKSLIQDFNDTVITLQSTKKKITSNLCSSPNKSADTSSDALSTIDLNISPIQKRNMSDTETVTLKTLLEEIRDFKETLGNKINDLKKEQAKHMQKFYDEISKLRKETEIKLKKLEDEIQDLNHRTGNLENKCTNPTTLPSSELQDKLNYMFQSLKKLENDGRKTRSNNIIIKGLPNVQDSTQTVKNTRKLLEEKFKVTDGIRSIGPLGKNGNICKVSFENTETKTKIMVAKKTSLKDTRIYIDNELTKQEQFIASKLCHFVKNNSDKRVRVVGHKIRIENSWFTWDVIEDKLTPVVTKFKASLGASPCAAYSSNKVNLEAKYGENQ